MKKIASLLLTSAIAVLLTSCSMESGAILGGMFGSAIGGLSGGPRGSHVGSLIGMAAGASIGAATEISEYKERQKETIRVRETRDRDFDRRYREHKDAYSRDYYKKNGMGIKSKTRSAQGNTVDPTNSGDDILLDF